MSTMEELHEKLEDIGAKVASARERMDFKRGLNDGHNLTSGELIARYRFLMEALNKEVAEIETQDRHVTALEQDAITWINGIDTGMSR